MSDFSQYSKEAMKIEYEKGYQIGQIEAFRDLCSFLFGICISDDEALRASRRINRAIEGEE